MRVLLAVFLVGIVFADDVFSNAGQAISQFGQQLQNQGSALAAESQKLANAASEKMEQLGQTVQNGVREAGGTVGEWKSQVGQKLDYFGSRIENAWNEVIRSKRQDLGNLGSSMSGLGSQLQSQLDSGLSQIKNFATSDSMKNLQNDLLNSASSMTSNVKNLANSDTIKNLQNQVQTLANSDTVKNLQNNLLNTVSSMTPGSKTNSDVQTAVAGLKNLSNSDSVKQLQNLTQSLHAAAADELSSALNSTKDKLDKAVADAKNTVSATNKTAATVDPKVALTQIKNVSEQVGAEVEDIQAELVNRISSMLSQGGQKIQEKITQIENSTNPKQVKETANSLLSNVIEKVQNQTGTVKKPAEAAKTTTKNPKKTTKSKTTTTTPKPTKNAKNNAANQTSITDLKAMIDKMDKKIDNLIGEKSPFAAWLKKQKIAAK